jgi:hypothetical protein
MSGINIKTADNDTLRYYICKEVTIEGVAPEAAPAAEETPAAEAAVPANMTAEAGAADTTILQSSNTIILNITIYAILVV